jgi:murein DD-endopeptidase MepM/ murein hydrolase activator NlpD
MPKFKMIGRLDALHQEILGAQKLIFEALGTMSGNVFKDWDYSEELNSTEQYPEHLGEDFAPLIEAIEPLNIAKNTFTEALGELYDDIKRLRESSPAEFLNNLREVFNVSALREVPTFLTSLAKVNIDLALSFGISFWRLPNQPRSEHMKALLAYLFNDGGYKTVSCKSIDAPHFFSAFDEKHSPSTEDSDDIRTIRAMLKDLEKQVRTVREQMTAERFIRDTARICVEVTGNYQYDLKNRYETLKNTRDSKLVGWFDSFGNLAEALVLPAAETILSGVGTIQMNTQLVSALATFCSVSARKAMEHAYLEAVKIPLTVSRTLNGSNVQGSELGKIPLEIAEARTSYLEDDRVLLRNGSIDEIGAKTYNKVANVPGNYVVDLQTDLATLGFSPGSADGFFGNLSEQALRTFQTTARERSRVKNGEVITIEPTYKGEANGECDEDTRTEITIWLRNGYRASRLSPPVWPHTEKPLMQNGIQFAEPTKSAKFWPVLTQHRLGRQVAYLGENGVTYGMSGRRFLATRDATRFHVGVDLWGDDGDIIIACEDGEIVNHYPFYHGVHALFVQCDSGLVINYGEVRASSWKEFGLDIGASVKAGEPIARVGRMNKDSMCHFETYREGTKANMRYFMGHEPPEALLDPTLYLLHLAQPSSQDSLPVTSATYGPSVATAPLADVPPSPALISIPGTNFRELDRRHSAFPGGARWCLTPKGIELEDTGIDRTPGRPVTVTRIWEKFSEPINKWALEYKVPCVLIIATIATESGGDHKAIRIEPGYISDQQTPKRISVGLMQTLISTARDTLKGTNVEIDRNWLLTPSNSIQAGTSYIAEQRGQTGYDPPKVACAYNAGGVYENAGLGNRWKMRQFPLGTGEHCDRFVKWFNDAVYLLSEHSTKPTVPYDVYLAS